MKAVEKARRPLLQLADNAQSWRHNKLASSNWKVQRLDTKLCLPSASSNQDIYVYPVYPPITAQYSDVAVRVCKEHTNSLVAKNFSDLSGNTEYPTSSVLCNVVEGAGKSTQLKKHLPCKCSHMNKAFCRAMLPGCCLYKHSIQYARGMIILFASRVKPTSTLVNWTQANV